MRTDERSLMHDVAEMIEAAHPDVEIKENPWGGYDFRLPASLVRVAQEDTNIFIYLYGWAGWQESSVRLTGQRNESLVASIVFAYMEQVTP
jgi:hypothetical protein